jgi:hypothetical protein
MTYGDRLALEGVLSQLRPGLAIEIGSGQGGSLARIAHHSDEVHAIDIVRHPLLDCPANATFHVGRSEDELPRLLHELERQGRNVDFVHVDGDHLAEVVRSDLETLLASPAVGRTVILLHDSFNEWVRAGIREARPERHPKVAFSSLDLVAGGSWDGGMFDGQLWGGFAIVLVDEEGSSDELDRIQFWLEGPVPMPATMDAWDTVVRSHRKIRRERPRAGLVGGRLGRLGRRLRRSLAA